MRISKFSNMYQLTLWPNFFPVNCYIIEEPNELILIDTGMPASFKGIVNLLNKLEKPLTNIILTHAHGDHVGSLLRLKNEYPETLVSISKHDSRLLRGDKTLDEHEPPTPIKGGVPKNLEIVPDRLLKEGDQVGSLEVVETPGHTPGSISLLDKINNMIIVGDAFQTQQKVAVCGQLVPLFPFPTFATWNKEVSLESAKKIQQLYPQILAAGHGKVLVNPKEQIDRAIVEAEKKLAE
ncbi:MBL fold metallo-hydrolase [Ureibacillus aquaedulcis]|uniref:MBL fold metallo-hydrolase n=1 Tax=Ureibacillus aquaedulcis TaxID=3058421 RepID=A0ABT8GUH8_9BACL|nr:MBL fold metallo-hydrolase [Ureibacillus sp. BA0131]MDN4495075.1 MBL fold metallo-hydrolase [Ureibacillus sp. BA0131]